MNPRVYRLTAALCALAVLPASAGVIMVQESTNPDGKGGTTKLTQTVTIEGNRQKSTDGKHTTIVDVDQGTMVMLDPEKKTATEMSFKSGPGASMMQGMHSAMSATFKPTGGHKTIAGYACDEYTGSSQMDMGFMKSEYSLVGCFSKDAPGAAEAAASYKKMMSGMPDGKPAAAMPEGVMLLQEMTVKMVVPPGMPPEAAAAMAKQGPQTSRTEVKSIKTATVAADAFAIPADYKREKLDMSMFGGGPSSQGPGAKPAPKAEPKDEPAAEDDSGGEEESD
jgi:hypothetical protein